MKPTTDVFTVYYTAPGWVGKPDPTGYGKCSHAFYSRDAAERKAEQLRNKRAGFVRIVHRRAK